MRHDDDVGTNPQDAPGYVMLTEGCGGWQRTGHVIQKCDKSDGYRLKTVALCDSEESAKEIFSALINV